MNPQTLLIRHSPEEGVLRSIGAMPNGIIGQMIGEGEATWTINSKWVPPAEKGTIDISVESREEAEDKSVPVSVPDLVTACEGQRELFSLAGTIISVTQSVIGALGPDRDFPTIRAAVDLLEETLMAVEESVRLRGGAR